MDQLAALRLFVHVARSKSIAAAGRSLGLSTTTASKRLQDLESTLNVRLVDRTTRQLALTEAGERLMSRSAGLLDELQTAFLEAKESPSTPAGTLRILARRSFGLLHLASVLPSFRHDYPRINIDMTLTEDIELVPRHGIDLVIRLGEPAEKTLVSHQLTSADLFICASPSYLARAGTPSSPTDLVRHECLTYRRAEEPTTWILRQGTVEHSIDVSGSLRSNNGEILRGAAIAGLGLTLLPDWMIAADLSSGKLCRCFQSYETASPIYRAPIYAVHRRGEVPAKISVFISHLRKSIISSTPPPPFRNR